MDSPLPFSGVPCGQTAPQTPDPYPSEGGGIIGAQNGARRASAMLHERDRTAENSWYSLLQTRHTTPDLLALVQQLAVGDAMETLWDEYFAPPHPAAFTLDAAGRLTLVTPQIAAHRVRPWVYTSAMIHDDRPALGTLAEMELYVLAEGGDVDALARLTAGDTLIVFGHL